jgi:hypothetical protein
VATRGELKRQRSKKRKREKSVDNATCGNGGASMIAISICNKMK